MKLKIRNEKAEVMVGKSNYDFEKKRELKSIYNTSVKIFQSENAEELTDVSYVAIKKLLKRFQISAVLNCEEDIFKKIIRDTNQNVELIISEERRLLLYTYFEDKLLVYYDK